MQAALSATPAAGMAQLAAYRPQLFATGGQLAGGAGRGDFGTDYLRRAAVAAWAGPGRRRRSSWS